MQEIIAKEAERPIRPDAAAPGRSDRMISDLELIEPVTLVVGVTADLTERFDAVALTRAGVAALGGSGGGGRSDMAQGGGPNAQGAAAALAAIEAAIAAAPPRATRTFIRR